MILETRHLRLVAGIVEHGSLTRAASHLHITQSGLSHQLLELEARLGTALFERVGRRLVPTAAGRQLLEAANDTLPRLERAEATLRRLARGGAAVLRLSTECYTCYHWLSQVMPLLQGEFPALDIEVVPEATLRPVAALLEGVIDAGIVHHVRRDPRVEYHRLFEDELVALLPPGHRLAGRSWLEAGDFQDERLFLYAVPREENAIYSGFLDPAGVTPGRVSTVALTEAVLELVRAGAGVTIMARWAAMPYLAAGWLVARPLTRRGLYRTWFLARRRQDRVPEHLRRFIELLSPGPARLLDAAGLTGKPQKPRPAVPARRGGGTVRRLARHAG